MKQILLVVAIIFSALAINAQSQTGFANFNKAPQSAVIYNLAYTDEAVSNALENKMKAYGKPKKVKDYLMYKNILITEISDKPVTIYFNVEKKSKKDDNNAVLTMLIANETDQFYTTSDHADLFKNAKKFLDSFEAPVIAANLELDINIKDELVRKVDKKLKKLRDDGIDYVNQKKKLEDKITDNNNNVTATELELLKQQEALDILIKKRKN